MRRQNMLPRQPNAPAKRKPGNNKPGKKHGNKPANNPVNNHVNKEFVPVNDNSVADNLKNNNIKFEQSGPFIVLK